MLVIDCISDLHGFYPKLEGGDLLIVAGDLTANSEPEQLVEYVLWLDQQNYRKKITIAGNHDIMLLGEDFYPLNDGEKKVYLCDSGTEFEGLKIWGTPWTKVFKGMNPHCMAFTCQNESELFEQWSIIPKNTDILISHEPPFGILDKVRSANVGSLTLKNVVETINPKLHVFGHIHEGFGTFSSKTQFVNASYVNEYYKPVNRPIRVIL